MKLTKFVHACVLVDNGDTTIMFDPGQFSWESGVFNITTLLQLDYIVISHEHFDHFSMPFVEALVTKFPRVSIISTQEVVDQLQAKGIAASTQSDEVVRINTVKHTSMEPFAPPPCENLHIQYADLVTHPGDTLNLTETNDVLLLPLSGPWASAIDAIRLADTLKPKIIIPIHDWMWNDQWRVSMYDRLEEFFGKQDIRFIKTVDGEQYEL